MSYSRASHPSAQRVQPTRASSSQAGSSQVASRGSGRASATQQPLAQQPLTQQPLKKARHSRKALWAGGSMTMLALLAIVPPRVGSQAAAQSSCQDVIRSGAEISRGQISQLLTVPEGATPEAVRQVINDPYCTLPPAETTAETTAELAAEKREAYPLAFDPEAWVVVNYRAGEYAGYDFVFKP